MPQSNKITLTALCAFGLSFASAGEALAGPNFEPGKIEIRPNEDTYFRFILWNQVWARVTQNNPGPESTPDVSADIAVRRSRFLAFGNFGKDQDVQLMFHFGINNQTFRNNEFGTRTVSGTVDTGSGVVDGSATDPGPNFFVHDAWVQFKLTNSPLLRMDVGGGLLYFNGVSRMNNASTLNFLAVDSPITTWFNINGNDQFARQLGLYAKGTALNQLIDYKVALVKPFQTGRWGNPTADTFGLASYVKLQFLEKESNTLPYEVGTYVGKKTVFNIGFGEYWQPNGGRPSESGEDRDVIVVGADIFADIPFGKDASGGALTGYALVQYSNFGAGPNLAHSAIMRNTSYAASPWVAGVGANGRGGDSNSYGLLGDGTVIYTQGGYLLPGWYGPFQIQPYGTLQINLWDAYEDPALVGEAGVNLFVAGHFAKVTLHYRARPVFDQSVPGKPVFDSFASEGIMQMMVMF